MGVTVEDIGCSEYLYSYHNVKKSPVPYFNMDEEFNLHNAVKNLIHQNWITAAHDCSDGGLFITLSEMGMAGNLGFDIVTDSEIREDAFLFGESQGRVVVTIDRDLEDEFIECIEKTTVPFILLGHVTKGKVVIDDEHFGFITEFKEKFDSALENRLL